MIQPVWSILVLSGPLQFSLVLQTLLQIEILFISWFPHPGSELINFLFSVQSHSLVCSVSARSKSRHATAVWLPAIATSLTPASVGLAGWLAGASPKPSSPLPHLPQPRKERALNLWPLPSHLYPPPTSPLCPPSVFHPPYLPSSSLTPPSSSHRFSFPTIRLIRYSHQASPSSRPAALIKGFPTSGCSSRVVSDLPESDEED